MKYICALFFLISLPVMATDWHSIAGVSTLNYTATYEGEPIEGKFSHFNVLLQTNNKTAAPEKLKVTVSITSADMSSDDINEAIRGELWFDMARFTTAEFNATVINKKIIDKKDDTHFVAHGVLKLKGIEKKLDVPFVWKADSQKAMLKGELIIKRSDYAIGSGEWASGDQIGIDVKVIFAVVLNAQK